MIGDNNWRKKDEGNIISKAKSRSLLLKARLCCIYKKSTL